MGSGLLAFVPWDLEPELPWQLFKSPLAQWEAQPSFLIGEYLFIALALLALWHARRCGRDHVLIWVAALLAGTANDLIFMALPLVDNFWQAQATIMLTPRLPLYIPCVYVCFMYYPTVAVRRLGLPSLSQAALTGLAAYIFYHPYDVVGAKFLWWTWHDTDLPISTRLLGAPTSSSLWTLTFVGAFGWLVDRALRRDPELSAKSFARGLITVAAFCTALMMLQMFPLQQLDGGAPGYRAFAAGISIYLGVTAWGWKRAEARPRPPADTWLWRAVVVYLMSLLLMGGVFDPATHRSEGIHQEPGPCYVESTDITGMTRHRWLCSSDFDEAYDFHCASPPEDHQRWFTVCGRPHENFGRWWGGLALLCVLAGLLFTYTLGGVGRRRMTTSP